MLNRDTKTKDMEERNTLIILLVINGFMFLAEIIVGIVAESTALIAD
jgi:Co/Zn/Cd efflux system component